MYRAGPSQHESRWYWAPGMARARLFLVYLICPLLGVLTWNPWIALGWLFLGSEISIFMLRLFTPRVLRATAPPSDASANTSAFFDRFEMVYAKLRWRVHETGAARANHGFVRLPVALSSHAEATGPGLSCLLFIALVAALLLAAVLSSSVLVPAVVFLLFYFVRVWAALTGIFHHADGMFLLQDTFVSKVGRDIERAEVLAFRAKRDRLVLSMKDGTHVDLVALDGKNDPFVLYLLREVWGIPSEAAKKPAILGPPREQIALPREQEYIHEKR